MPGHGLVGGATGPFWRLIDIWLLATTAVLACGGALVPKPIDGPYKVEHKLYDTKVFDESGPNVDVWSPRASNMSKKFPLISYAHGFAGGGVIEPIAYFELLRRMAEFGYIIVAPRACDLGCRGDRTSLPHDPHGFGHYYYQQLLGIKWAKNMSIAGDENFNIDWTIGVGVAGHSMGGQATLFSSSYNASSYNIKAAVMHHAYTHNFPTPQIPFIVFTGSLDATAPAVPMATGIFNTRTSGPRALINKYGATHHEPDVLDFNPLLPQFSVAWFKIYLEKTPYAFGHNFSHMIFGSGEDSVCHGGDGRMVPEMCRTFKN